MTNTRTPEAALPIVTKDDVVLALTPIYWAPEQVVRDAVREIDTHTLCALSVTLARTIDDELVRRRAQRLMESHHD
jgi:hypothetical protein